MIQINSPDAPRQEIPYMCPLHNHCEKLRQLRVNVCSGRDLYHNAWPKNNNCRWNEEREVFEWRILLSFQNRISPWHVSHIVLFTIHSYNNIFSYYSQHDVSLEFCGLQSDTTYFMCKRKWGLCKLSLSCLSYLSKMSGFRDGLKDTSPPAKPTLCLEWGGGIVSFWVWVAKARGDPCIVLHYYTVAIMH